MYTCKWTHCCFVLHNNNALLITAQLELLEITDVEAGQDAISVKWAETNSSLLVGYEVFIEDDDEESEVCCWTFELRIKLDVKYQVKY